MKNPTFASCIIGAASFLALLGCTQPTLAARLVDVSIVNRSTGERLTPWRHDGKLYVCLLYTSVGVAQEEPDRGLRVARPVNSSGFGS